MYNKINIQSQLARHLKCPSKIICRPRTHMVHHCPGVAILHIIIHINLYFGIQYNNINVLIYVCRVIEQMYARIIILYGCHIEIWSTDIIYIPLLERHDTPERSGTCDQYDAGVISQRCVSNAQFAYRSQNGKLSTEYTQIVLHHILRAKLLSRR